MLGVRLSRGNGHWERPITNQVVIFAKEDGETKPLEGVVGNGNTRSTFRVNRKAKIRKDSPKPEHAILGPSDFRTSLRSGSRNRAIADASQNALKY